MNSTSPTRLGTSARRRFALASCLSVAAMVAGTLVGCAGELDNADEFGPPPECRIDLDVEALFRDQCGTGTCHGNETDDPAAGLDLVSNGFAANMVGAPSDSCDGRLRIDPNYPNESFLIEKLEGPRDGCGDRMPRVGTLSDAEIACVRDWVRLQAQLHGAQDAGVPADMGLPDASAEDSGGGDADVVDGSTP